jgi:predicted dehydrogenase
MKKLRWGLIGCGDISRKRVAPALRGVPECELIAVSRARAGLAEAFANEFGAKRWYGDWRELIADDEIDAVYIATPVYLHKEIVASGEIGKPVIAQINAFERFNPAPGENRYWLLEKSKSGGGPMMDVGCHRLEILLNLFGPIARTTAVIGRALFDREVEDACVASFEFGSGTQASLAVTHAAFESVDTLDIYCSAGSIHTASLNRGEIRIVTAAGERIESRPPHANLHQPLIEDFTRAVLDGRGPEVGGEVGLAVAMIEAEIYALCAS